MDGPISQHHTVRQSYDAVAQEYLERFRDELAGKPLDRALLACLAEQAEVGAPVADLGCGPGHVAAWLTGRGVALVGIDLSPAMIAAGRRDYPQVEFRQGDFLGLPAANGEFAAAVAFYSITDAKKYRTTFWYIGDRHGDRMASRPGGYAYVRC